jgi:LPS export ABC transporter permease LptF
MRASPTLARSLIAEILIYAGLGSFGFIGLLLVLNLAHELEDLIAVGLSARDAWAVLRALIPIVAGYAAPVGLLFGVLAAVGRAAADLEVVAMRACGLGVGQLLVPTLAIALAFSLLTAFLLIGVEPQARLALRHQLRDVASRGAVLEPGRFRNVAGRVVYVDGRDADGGLERVVISDHSVPERPFVVFAERAHFRFDAQTATIHLELETGNVIFDTNDPGDLAAASQRMAFEHFDYAFDASPILDVAASIRPRDLPMGELVRRLRLARADALPPEIRRRNVHEYEVQLHRRFSLPVAPVLFAGIALPLALRRSRANRAWGVLACTAIVSVYYLVLTTGERLADRGALAAWIALWFPNLLFAAGAGLLLWRAQGAER